MFCLAAQGEPLPAGPQVATFISTIDGSEQPYGLYLPKYYDAHRKYPLVVMLHGAGSNHRLALRRVFGKSNLNGESDAEATKYFPPWKDVEYIVASPLARGTMGYQGLPEQDVYDVLADVEKRFTIDENRVYLTGLSMGGGGTLWIGLTHPDIWAAIAPVCPAPPAGTILLAPNALNIPVQVSQGDVDQSVNPAKTREFVDHLRLFGTKIEYHEYPGVGHNVWENAYKDEAIFSWFDHYRREPFPDRVRFVSSHYRYDHAYWVHFDELTPGTLAAINAKFTGRNELTITTADLDAFTLNLTGHPKFNVKRAVKVELDGQKLDVKAGDSISFTKKGWVWSVGHMLPAPQHWNITMNHESGIGLQNGPAGLAPGPKRPGAEGPLCEIASRKQIYVYATADHPGQDELDKRKDQATQAAHWAAVTFPVMADTELSGADLEKCDLVLFGNRENNSVIARFGDQLPLALKPDAAGYGLVYIYPVGDRYILVNSGLPWWTLPKGVRTAGGRNGGPAGMLRSTDVDFLLFKESANDVVADGHFDHNWQLPAQALREFKSGDVVTVKATAAAK